MIPVYCCVLGVTRCLRVLDDFEEQFSMTLKSSPGVHEPADAGPSAISDLNRAVLELV